MIFSRMFLRPDGMHKDTELSRGLAPPSYHPRILVTQGLGMAVPGCPGLGGGPGVITEQSGV